MTNQINLNDLLLEMRKNNAGRLLKLEECACTSGSSMTKFHLEYQNICCSEISAVILAQVIQVFYAIQI